MIYIQPYKMTLFILLWIGDGLGCRGLTAEPSNQYLSASCDRAMCKLLAQENRDILKTFVCVCTSVCAHLCSPFAVTHAAYNKIA